MMRKQQGNLEKTPNQLDPKAGQTTLQGEQASASSSPPPRPRDIKSGGLGGEEIMGSGSARRPNPLHSASLPDQQVGHFYPPPIFPAFHPTFNSLDRLTVDKIRISG